jgi:hypothetical protein
MAAVTDLLDRTKGVKLAYLFVIEGIYIMWCEGFYAGLPSLYGSGVSSWIGTAYGARTVKPGLELPVPIYQDSIRPTGGMILDDDVEVTLTDDESGYLAQLFRSQFDPGSRTRLGERLAPSDDPAPATLKGWDQLTNVTIRDRHIGNEYIGASGERRSLYITPDTGTGTPAGLDHPVLADQGDGSLPPVYVSEEPQNFVGRRCAIYEIVYDEDLGVWANWANQYAGGAMIWNGHLTDRVRFKGGRKWQIQCSGFAGWMRKRLGTHMHQRELKPLPTLSLSQEEANDETWCGVFFSVSSLAYDSDLEIDYNYNWHVDNRYGTSFSVREIAIRTYDILRCAASGNTSDYGGAETTGVASGTNNTGPGTYWENEVNENGDSGYAANGDADEGRWYSLRIPNSTFGGSAPNRIGMIRIVRHRKVWEAMGWDLSRNFHPGGPGPIAHGFEKLDENKFHVGDTKYQTPGPDYWMGYFSTAEKTSTSPNDWDNNGAPRTWQATQKGNVVVLDSKGGQYLTLGFDKIYCEGQNARPPALNVTIDGTACNSMGWFLFSAPLAYEGDDGEVVVIDEHYEVARLSWVTESDGSVRQNASGQTVMWMEGFEDGRMFGLGHKAFEVNTETETAWVTITGKTKIESWRVYAGRLKMRQIAVLPGYRPGTPDDNWRALLRILLSSGTSGTTKYNGWTGVNSPPSVGDNDHGGGEFWGNDVEFQDFGLNIEPDRVDWEAFQKVASAYLDNDAARLNRFRWASAEPVLSQDLIQAVCRTRGLCMRLKMNATKGPQYSIFAPFTWKTDDDVEVVLTESDIHGKAGDPASWVMDQELRWESPVDKFSISAGHHPVDGTPSIEVNESSWDTWRRGREGKNELDIDGRGLVDPRDFVGEDEWEGARWIEEFRDLHARAIGPWRAERHFTVTTKRLRGAKARKLYSGAAVSLTDQRVLAPDGTYGISGHVGFVLSKRRFKGGHVEATILLQAHDASAVRYWSPLGEVDEYEHDYASVTLKTSFSGHSYGWADAYGFTEDGWNTAIGGTAKIRIRQSFDGGASYSILDDFVADIVSVAGNVISIENEAGVLYGATHKWAYIEWATSHAADAWPVQRYAIVTDENGEWNSNAGVELL